MKNQQTYIYISFWKTLEATLKSKQPFTLPYILSPTLQACHIPNASGHYLPI